VTGDAKLIYAMIAYALIIIGVLFFMQQPATNCWDNYQTEREAIMACEGGQ
jgi:uncharacterized membrane protein